MSWVEVEDKRRNFGCVVGSTSSEVYLLLLSVCTHRVSALETFAIICKWSYPRTHARVLEGTLAAGPETHDATNLSKVKVYG